MSNPERTFGVISKKGSMQSTGTPKEVMDDVLWFLENVAGLSIGVVPASAPKKEDEDGNGNGCD